MGSFDSIDYLPKKPFGLALLQHIILNVLIQFPPVRQLHHHEDFSSSIEHLVQFYDIGVVDELQDADLPFDLSPSMSYLRDHL